MKWTNLAFQTVYIVEMLMRIFAAGLVMTEGAFLRDFWNIADLIIVVLGFLDFFKVDDPKFDPRPLRIFRVFRPFRAIAGVEGIKAILTVLATSLPLLLYVLLIYLFYLCVLAIVGLQLWHGSFKVRCMNEATGEFDLKRLCGYKKCPDEYVCTAYNETLSYGFINFDNFLSSLLISFIVSTDEGGPVIQKALIENEGYYVTIYFTLILLIGNYFLKNFILGVFQYNINLLYVGSKEIVESKPIPIASTPVHKYKSFRPPSDFLADPDFFLNREINPWKPKADQPNLTLDHGTELMQIEEGGEYDLSGDSERDLEKNYGNVIWE
eukprot:TRINITY_DN310_c0_g2_i1.p2 TRINITY_DN310_c0_g2~~TRINITY_DN310_c0_g2_i1.p2  ORF type:complete len:324 (+),score=86.87 TRINITY_DN310_c0_g2_i1:747-1718(+)